LKKELGKQYNHNSASTQMVVVTLKFIDFILPLVLVNVGVFLLPLFLLH